MINSSKIHPSNLKISRWRLKTRTEQIRLSRRNPIKKDQAQKVQVLELEKWGSTAIESFGQLGSRNGNQKHEQCEDETVGEGQSDE